MNYIICIAILIAGAVLSFAILYYSLRWSNQITEILKQKYPEIYERNKNDLKDLMLVTNKDIKDSIDPEITSLRKKIIIGLCLICILCWGGGSLVLFLMC